LGNRSKVVDKKEACHHQQSFLSLLRITDPAITRNLRPAKKKKSRATIFKLNFQKRIITVFVNI